MSLANKCGDIQWRNSLHLIIYENHNHREYYLHNQEALNEIVHLEKNEEQILEAKIWKNSLRSYIPPLIGIWYEFTVVKSTNYYWSFEKRLDGIYIQRSKDILDVKNMFNGKNRTAMVWPEGRSNFDLKFGDNISDIIKWILNTGQLYEPPRDIRHNQFFASLLYEAVVRAKNGRLDEKICIRVPS